MAKKVISNKTKSIKKINPWVLAKTSDGTIQITYTIPFATIKKELDHVLHEFAGKINVPGFRKGKAPITKVREKVPQNELYEHTLSHILPSLLGETIQKEKLKLAIYPKFQLISAEDNKDWQVQAISCEVPEFELGDYKKDIVGAARTGALWTPDKGSKEEKPKELTTEQKEQIVIETLIKTVKINIPNVLVQEEVNSRLSKLLERIEKLGLSLEQYLASLGKNAESIRDEYEKQAIQALTLDMVLLKIAEIEKLEASDKDVEDAINQAVTSGGSGQFNTPEQRSVVHTVLKKRKTLEKLTSYL
jgi:FKBP-type peptidyl-prolyl cis-trans isomerase (trigger factor)